MSFISPMMAKPLPKDFEPEPGEWVAEEKLDGHRIITCVDDRPADLFGDRVTRAWSRYERDRVLPPHIRASLELLPNGVYDGELLVPGERSYGTVVLENSDKLVYVVFDVLVLLDRDLVSSATYDERRAFLAEIFRNLTGEECQFKGVGVDGLQFAWSEPISCMHDVHSLRDDVWARDGEGLILKNRESLYVPGKRPKNAWYKIKQLRTSVLTVVEFRQGRMGPNSIVLLRDDDGCETTVKWKNYEELDRIDADPQSFVGRKLRIEFQERTPDGSYRHPRWDRWEDE